MITALYLLSIKHQFELTSWMMTVWSLLLIMALGLSTLIAIFLAFNWRDLSPKVRWGCFFAALTI
jgi:hypothetical protein